MKPRRSCGAVRNGDPDARASRWALCPLVGTRRLNLPCRTWPIACVDGDKLNNAASNLEWVDCRENIRRAIATGVRPSQHGTNSVRSKLTAEQVCVIRGEPHQHGVLTRLARRFGVSRETIARIRSGRSYRDRPDSRPKTTRENHT